MRTLSILLLMAGLSLQYVMVMVTYHAALMPSDALFAGAASTVISHCMDELGSLGKAIVSFALMNAGLFVLYAIVVHVLLSRRKGNERRDDE